MELVAARRRQPGFVLALTLVIMVIMILGTLAVLRSTTNSNLMAGNFAFREAGVQASERAMRDGLNALAAIVKSSGTGNTVIANRYFNIREVNVDAQGIPTAINWSNVACLDQDGNACPASTSGGDYRLQYYLERQCAGNPNLGAPASIKSQCDYEVLQASPEILALRYRIIVRMQGPRGTVAFLESQVSGPP